MHIELLYANYGRELMQSGEVTEYLKVNRRYLIVLIFGGYIRQVLLRIVILSVPNTGFAKC